MANNSMHFSAVPWAYGPSLVWGGGHSIICPNRQTEHYYFAPKLLASGWGRPTKIFFRTYQEHFSGHTKHFSTNIRKFCRTYPKISPNTMQFSQRYKNFLVTYQNFSEIFMFCPNFALIFARPQKFCGPYAFVRNSVIY